MIGWKKVWSKGHRQYAVAKLEIDSRVISENGKKLRCDGAKVISIELLKNVGVLTPKFVGTGKFIKRSAPYMRNYRRDFVYEVGMHVTPDRFDIGFNACSNGIHFYSTRKEAVNHV